MTLVARIRAQCYAKAIRHRAGLYSVNFDRQARLTVQLATWNREWQRLVNSVPYYHRLREQRRLPDKFTSWEEFTETVPITTRGHLQEHKREMTSLDSRPHFYRITGGSTAEPIQLPAWNSETKFNLPDMWLGRSWYGITPASRLFLLWGHSHLLGSGFRGWLKGHKRRFSDWLVGYYRFSAYDLRPSTLRRAADTLIRFRPDYVMGYSVALDLFARTNRDRRTELRQLRLKVVLGAAESFPFPESVGLLEDLFACPVAMEYGSVETGLMAHMHPRGGYDVFWRSYFMEAERSSRHRRGWVVRVTSLYPRCFPLVRYELGDEVELDEATDQIALSLARFNRVIGRCNSYLIAKDGSIIHSELFTHILRSCPDIKGYQVSQRGEVISIRYLAAQPLSCEQVESATRALIKVNPNLSCIKLTHAEKLEQTIAGKTPMVITTPTGK